MLDEEETRSAERNDGAGGGERERGGRPTEVAQE